MKKNYPPKDDKKLFESFINAGISIDSNVSRSLEDRIMTDIYNKKQIKKRWSLDWFQFPIRQRLAGITAVFILLFAGVFLIRMSSGTDAPFPEGSRLVSFKTSYPGAKTVCLVGDFNSWKKNSDCLKKVNGHWVIKKVLKAGQLYKYAFVINNKRILHDSHANQYVDDEFGGRTAVVFVN
ncbi:MAG: isoamylase early set domain-containing protein [Spirochaetes bacterium]|nr:isoamylase early set domain-containing protein [Spirochaetota bacterium]